MTHLVFDGLNQKVEQLISYCSLLEEENQRLLAQKQQLQDQCQQLSQKNSVACQRIETLIGKLKVRLAQMDDAS